MIIPAMMAQAAPSVLENMQGIVTWGALIAAGGSMVAVIRFWMDRGAAQAEAKQAAIVASTAVAKADLLERAFNDYRVEAERRIGEVVKPLASHSDLAESERRVAQAIDAMRGDMRNVVERIDRLLLVHNKPNS